MRVQGEGAYKTEQKPKKKMQFIEVLSFSRVLTCRTGGETNRDINPRVGTPLFTKPMFNNYTKHGKPSKLSKLSK